MPRRVWTTGFLALAFAVMGAGGAAALAADDYFTRQVDAFRRARQLAAAEDWVETLFWPEPEAVAESRAVRFVINLPSRELTVYRDGRPFKRYPVAIGQLGYKTPVGPRRIRQVVWNPWWFPPDEEWAKNDVDTPPGPHNPLGKVKLPLGGDIVLHGTNQPGSVGRAASHGCLRMKNRDIIELAWWVQRTFSDRDDEALLERYLGQWGATSTVPLREAIPVEIIYEPIQVEHDELVIHPNIYLKRRNVWGEMLRQLEQVGIDSAQVDWDRLPTGPPGQGATRVPLRDLILN